MSLENLDIIPLQKWIPNLNRPLIIAGPCSAETEEQVLKTAMQLKELGNVPVFRAGIWKPRTRPNAFEGVGAEGLKWMELVKKKTGLLTTTEVANAKHAELALKHNIDILWIGARTSANPFSVQEIADAIKGTNIPVMVKNPINVDLSLWMGALERIAGAGITKLAAIHRGFSNYQKTQYRNCPMWNIPIELKRKVPKLPIICDPSHISGKRDLIYRVCQKAMDADMDGLMIETHIDPNKALSDAAQQVTPDDLGKIIHKLSLRTEFTSDKHFEEKLTTLRNKIDRVDHDLVELLSMRMKIVNDIANEKGRTGITPLQIHRMDELMNKRIALGESFGLKGEYVKDIYNVIHTESVREQTNIINEFKDSDKNL